MTNHFLSVNHLPVQSIHWTFCLNNTQLFICTRLTIHLPADFFSFYHSFSVSSFFGALQFHHHPFILFYQLYHTSTCFSLSNPSYRACLTNQIICISEYFLFSWCIFSIGIPNLLGSSSVNTRQKPGPSAKMKIYPGTTRYTWWFQDQKPNS